ncbi:MAG: tetratricopeptide repeat protein, partial [Pseudomonadota bacterium]
CLRLALLDPEKTPAERLEPVQDACSDGHMFACRMQAELLTDQAGRFQDGRTDRERAKALFLFACENDDADACYRYARILAERSRSYNADAELIDIAISYWERACLAGHADACRSLGYEYEEELTTNNPRNLDLSFHFHERACALDSRSCEGLARVNVEKSRNALRSEHGVLKSALMSHEADFKEEYRARVRRYRRDCEAGDMVKCINLGERYVDALEVDGVYGLPHSTPRDRVWALALYGLACDAGNAAGCEAFAAAFEYAGTRSDPEIALWYSQKGCALGAVEGCYRLGDFHLKGEHVARDLAAADRYFRKACNFGMEDACKRLADREFTEANLSNPHDRLIFACVHGDWYACSRLRDGLRQMSFFKRRGDLIREFDNIACDEGDEEMCRNLGRTQND